MAAYNTERKKFGREPFFYVEIDVDSTTYTFCSKRSPLPVGFNGIPCLSGDPSFSPCEIDPSGGIGIRGVAQLGLDDFLDYSVFGTATAPLMFWPVWRANHPYYQGVPVRVYSGYISEGNQFDSTAFSQRYYVLESFSYSNGMAKITAKDPLKLANNDRAQYPAKSTGYLSADINAAVTTLTLAPTGIGDAEYPASGYVTIGEEIMTYTRVGDVMTVTRGQFNTAAAEHSADDLVQESIYINDTLDQIMYEILVTGAGINPSFIPTADWASEAEIFLPGLYETILTEPVGVTDLIKELIEQAPHRLYWDERGGKIRLVAIKEPPASAPIAAEGQNIIGSGSWSDRLDMRVSTVIVNYGRFDPTKPLDETSNYRQGYVRQDPDSLTDYGTLKIKTINSRWINNDNKSAARLLAAKWGRRYSQAPRMIGFSLDASSADAWTGQWLRANLRSIVDASGNRINVPVEVLSVQEAGVFKYKTLEHTYGQELAQDEGIEGAKQVTLASGEIDQLRDGTGPVRTLRDIFETLYGTPQADDDVVFVFDYDTIAGSSDNTGPAVKTGTWPELTTPIKIINRGYIVGRGGNGGAPDANGQDGGTAIEMQDDIRLDNSGVIGGGGGGGGGSVETEPGFTGEAGGGGGAGYVAGSGAIFADDGTLEDGGSGYTDGLATSGSGGNLGQAGGNGSDGDRFGGSAGAAIITNSNTITYINAGDIRGAVT